MACETQQLVSALLQTVGFFSQHDGAVYLAVGASLYL
jgi:hypothetical protein